MPTLATVEDLRRLESTLLGRTNIRPRSITGDKLAPTLQSPNFSSSGGTGWQINFDGSASFYSLTASATITGGSLSIGSGNNIFRVDTSGNMWLGNAVEGSAPFQVDNTGALTATSGTFSGSLSGATITGATGTFTGSITGATGTFTGSITGASGIFSGSIAIGSGDTIVKADANGLYVGNATFGSAPFRVTQAGAVTATSIAISGSSTFNGTITTGSSITGVVTSEGGSSVDWTHVDNVAIVNADITNLSADKINTGTLSSATIDIGTNAFQVDGTGRMFMGAATFDAADAGIDASGNIHMNFIEFWAPPGGSGNRAGSLGFNAVDFTVDLVTDNGSGDDIRIISDGDISLRTNLVERVLVSDASVQVSELLYQLSTDDAGLRLRDTGTSGAITKYIRYEDSGGTEDARIGVESGVVNIKNFRTNAGINIVPNGSGDVHVDLTSGHAQFTSTDDAPVRVFDDSTTSNAIAYVMFGGSDFAADGRVGLVSGSIEVWSNIDSVEIGTNNTRRWIFNATTGDFRPNTNASSDIGTSSFGVGKIFADLSDDTTGDHAVLIDVGLGELVYNSSTARFKDNIIPWDTGLSGSWTDAVKAFSPKSWNKTRTHFVDRQKRNDQNPQTRDVTSRDVGLIAEDVLVGLGEDAISRDGDGEVVNYKDRAVLSALVGAVGELNSRLAALEAA